MSPNDREQPLSETEVADARTLVLSAVQLTPALLDQFVGYQRALLKLRAEAPQGLHESDRHRLELEAEIAAQQGSGLTLRQTHQLSAMARDILGRLWTWRELNRRKAELEAQKTRTPREQEKLDRLSEELFKKNPLPSLEKRYGAENLALIQAREAELLELHRRVHDGR